MGEWFSQCHDWRPLLAVCALQAFVEWRFGKTNYGSLFGLVAAAFMAAFILGVIAWNKLPLNKKEPKS